MKKTCTLILFLSMLVLSAHADLWLEENFNYADGPLEQSVTQLELHKWIVSRKANDALGTSPMVANRNLSYSGYVASGQGKVAVLDPAVGSASSSQRISVYYIDTLGARDTMSVYAAFLLKPVSAYNTTGRDFVIWEGSVGSSMVRGRLFMAKSADKVKIGITKNSTTISAWSEDLEVNTTHLIVMKYEYNPGASNDVVKVFVNPHLDKTEEANSCLVSSDNATDMQLRGFGLRQRGTGAEIGGLRIATTWAEALGVNPADLNDDVVPTVDPNLILEESFDYTTGSLLEGQGGWLVSTATADQGGLSPAIGENTLSYTGYGCTSGKSMLLDSVAQGISGDLKRNTVLPFASDKLGVEDTIYTAFLVNFSAMNSTSGKEFFAYLKQGAANGDNTTMRGRVMVAIQGNDKQFAIRKNSQTITAWSASSPKDETALLVVRYINRSTGSTKDPDHFCLYVNPDLTKSEAENAACRLEAEGNEADGGADLRYIAFRQMKMNATIAGIRIAKTWAAAVNYNAEVINGLFDTFMDAADNSPRKMLIDGQLFIFRGEHCYTITGQPLR